MASALTHAVVGLCAGLAFCGGKKPVRLCVLAAACAAAPDADVIAFSIGIPYGSFWAHRGFLHSASFAALLSLFVAKAFFRRADDPFPKAWQLPLFFFLVMMTHALLDLMTNGTLGIALLSPFDQTRFQLPWRPIPVSPIGVSAFLSAWGLKVLAKEVPYVWVPALLGMAAVRAFRGRAGRSSVPDTPRSPA
jgi:inner membrane protein